MTDPAASADASAPTNCVEELLRSGLTATQLRAKAAEHLCAAQALDGYLPVIVCHSNGYGISTYVVYAHAGVLSAEDAAKVLDSLFEPGKGQWLQVSDTLSVVEMAGASESSLSSLFDAPIASSAEGETLLDRRRKVADCLLEEILLPENLTFEASNGWRSITPGKELTCSVFLGAVDNPTANSVIHTFTVFFKDDSSAIVDRVENSFNGILSADAKDAFREGGARVVHPAPRPSSGM